MRLETWYIYIEKSISIIDRNFHIDYIDNLRQVRQHYKSYRLGTYPERSHWRRFNSSECEFYGLKMYGVALCIQEHRGRDWLTQHAMPSTSNGLQWGSAQTTGNPGNPPQIADDNTTQQQWQDSYFMIQAQQFVTLDPQGHGSLVPWASAPTVAAGTPGQQAQDALPRPLPCGGCHQIFSNSNVSCVRPLLLAHHGLRVHPSTKRSQTKTRQQNGPKLEILQTAIKTCLIIIILSLWLTWKKKTEKKTS